MSLAAPIRALRDVSLADVHQVGGKAAGLGEILRAGYSVPPGFVIPFDHRALWSQGTDRDFETKIGEQCAALDANYYAVRSSNVIEDGPTASWAGQFATYLGVKADEVPGRIYDCLRSSDSAHATAYAASSRAGQGSREMAVIVQAMVASEISGVLFTVDPVSQDESRCALEVVAGLGEVLVQGRVTPQSYVLDKATGAIASEHHHRQREAISLREDGLHEVTLPVDYELPVTKKTIQDLVHIGQGLERHFGMPQDIEWASACGKLLVLQSRPITTLQSREPPQSGTTTLPEGQRA